MKCPKSSTKQILNANGITLTPRAWQRSNRIVYRHKDRLFKSNQLKLLEIIWNATILHRNDTLSPCLDVAAACIRVSNHIWSFYDVAAERRCSNIVAIPKIFKRSFWQVSWNSTTPAFHKYSHFLWFAAKDHAGLDHLTSCTRENGLFISRC